eukprot:g1297.t1
MTNSWLWITWSPIEDDVAAFWTVEKAAIDQLSTVFMYTYIICALPALWVLSRKGLRWGLMVGSVGNVVGSAIRLIGNTLVGFDGRTRFAFSFLGSFVASLAQLFILAIPPFLSMSWFKKGERAFATNVGVLFNQLGTALGLGVTGICVRDVSRESMFTYLMLQTATCAVSVCLVYCFVEDRPRVRSTRVDDPSLDEGKGALECTNEIFDAEVSKTLPDFLRNARDAVLSDRNVFILTVAYGASTGVFYAIATFLSQTLPSWSNRDAGLLGLDIVLAGAVGCIVVGLWLDRYQSYKRTTRVLFVLTTASLSAWTVCVRYFPRNHILLYTVAAALGFFITSILGAGFELAVELTYRKTGEATVAGMLNISAQFFGCVLIWIGEPIISSEYLSGRNSVMATNAMLSVVIAAATAATFLVRGRLLRLEGMSPLPLTESEGID